MVLVRYWQTAIIAAILALAGNAVWAQETKPGTAGTYISGLKSCSGTTCCKDGKCCKDGDCCCESKKCDAKCTSCKESDCCCASKKCDAKCTCRKDDKCECCKGGECGCGKSGKCTCEETESACCPIMNTLAKHTAIIMVMPASMPLPNCWTMETIGMMPHPPMPPGPGMIGRDIQLHVMGMMPPGPHVCLPPMPPHIMPPMPVMAMPQPILGYDGAGNRHVLPPMPGMAMPHAMPVTAMPRPIKVHEAHPGNSMFGVGVNSSCGLCGSITAVGTPIVVSSCCGSSKVAAKVRITPIAGNDSRLEMRVGEETCIRCKKMTITVGENEITVSRFDDRVRVRGDELKATACSVRTDGKDRLILEGDVVMHYKKEGHAANVIGERVELNLSNSALTIQRTAKTSVPAVYSHPVDAEIK